MVVGLISITYGHSGRIPTILEWFSGNTKSALKKYHDPLTRFVIEVFAVPWTVLVDCCSLLTKQCMSGLMWVNDTIVGQYVWARIFRLNEIEAISSRPLQTRHSSTQALRAFMLAIYTQLILHLSFRLPWELHNQVYTEIIQMHDIACALASVSRKVESMVQPLRGSWILTA